ncbi:MAG: translation initiation factor IF-2 [Thermoanaerobaculales bacterium]|nr:translation initiation factor IF-2 [Thermoanaerobaculales bacterium]
MQQLRVVDLAHTMGISARELIFKLRSIGVSVNSEEDTLDLSTVRAIITGETLQKRPREVIQRRDQQEQESQSVTARDRMARRRRRQVMETEHEIREVVTEKKETPKPTAEATIAETEVTADEPATTEQVSEAIEVDTVEAEVVEVVEEQPVELDASEAEPTVEHPDEIVAEAEVQTEEVASEPEIETSTEAVEAEVPVKKVESEGDDEIVRKPAPEVREEEFTTERTTEEEEKPKRVQASRAKTPLERTLRVLSPDEIKQRLKDQKLAEERRKAERARGRTKPVGSRKAKAAADAKEIRDLLNRFEEQKVKGQTEGSVSPTSRPAPRPTGQQRLSKKARRRQQQQEATRRPAPPRPSRTVQFKDEMKPEGPIILSEMVTARELAEKLNITAKDLLGMLIKRGMMVTTNQALPHELAEEICAELEVDAMVATAEELVEFEREEAAEASGPLEPRPPVVTVMGHVDHGKTSLLDAMRSSRVAEGEAGGITQHVGASKIVTKDDRVIVFVDTPGHEAFTKMRARGAQITDIVVLVVAADDGVMPQTKEAINHARAANVPLIVAMNKIDKNNAAPDRVKQQLAEVEVLVEDWGGDIPCIPVSAKTGDGVSELLDMILLVSEMREFKASSQGAARGVVLEAQKEKGRGIVATVVLQQGTLGIGDPFFCGTTWGRVRALANETGGRVQSGGPSDPVEIMGFDGVPNAGDVLQVVENEERALEVASFRRLREREEGFASTHKISLENLFDHISAGDQKELNVVIKADVQGSVEVLREAMSSLGTDDVSINTLHGSVGAVTTNDVMLAAASNAIIIGFSVRPERTARDLAETENVDIRLYTVIYSLIDDIKKAMVGLLDPEFKEEELGRAEVREVFKVPKIGSIAGSHVLEGVIKRDAKVRLLRDNVVIHEGAIGSLRRFKDDASEVRQGFECGIGLEKYNDIKVNDIIEAFQMIEIEREL